MAKVVYKNPQAGQPLISIISTECRTPILDVKFSNLINAYYYPNSPTVPRYSITCLIDPDKHKEFLLGIQTIEKNENVDSILKNETMKENKELVTTGKILIKFQGKEMIPVYAVNTSDGPEHVNEESLMDVEDELATGEKIIVVYDILRYTKKNTMKTEHGISFKPSRIYYYAKKA